MPADMIVLIFLATILCIIVRPRGIQEWVYASVGGSLLVLFGLISPRLALEAIARGHEVYYFLLGMMLLAEIARQARVFDWLASYAVVAAQGSRLRLFGLIYLVGIVVTVILSNDATAVVLTPAVAAVMRKTDVEPLPYLLVCAFIANAASFVLPISNPANFVVFGGSMPNLFHWLSIFFLPSVLAIVATFVVLVILFRRDLLGEIRGNPPLEQLGFQGVVSLSAIGLTVLVLMLASIVQAPLGLITCICGLATLLGVALTDRSIVVEVLRQVPWSVLLLVASLFVLVGGLETTGLLQQIAHGLSRMQTWPPFVSLLSVGVLTAVVVNCINNLPAGLIAGNTLAAVHAHEALRASMLISVDLSPNLSITGSLATVLWLIVLRREKITMSGWDFLRVGCLVMPPALILAIGSIVARYAIGYLAK